MSSGLHVPSILYCDDIHFHWRSRTK